MQKFWFATLGLAIAASAHADRIDFNVNDNAFEARYVSPIFKDGGNFDLGWLHHEDNGNVGFAGIYVEQEVEKDTTVAIGGRALYLENDYDDASAIALGGSFNIGLPSEPRVRFGAHGYMAPRVTSFGDAKSFYDWGVRAGFRVLPRGELYVGYQNLEMKYENDAKWEFDDSFHVGMELTF